MKSHLYLILLVNGRCDDYMESSVCLVTRSSEAKRLVKQLNRASKHYHKFTIEKMVSWVEEYKIQYPEPGDMEDDAVHIAYYNERDKAARKFAKEKKLNKHLKSFIDKPYRKLLLFIWLPTMMSKIQKHPDLCFSWYRDSHKFFSKKVKVMP